MNRRRRHKLTTMKFSNTYLQLRDDNYGEPHYCDRVLFENEDVFDTITDVDCIIEAEYVDDDLKITLHSLQCYNIDNELVVPDDEVKIKALIYDSISFYH
jgi:hypothetical protein